MVVANFFSLNIDLTNHPFDAMVRLCFALGLGAAIGWEREKGSKPAGLRTHTMVSLGSALFVIAMLAQENPPDVNALSRIIQGISTGIGFLGAGEILTQSSKKPGKLKVKGLTSAAAIWFTAALGVLAGLGLWWLGLFAIALSWVVLKGFKYFE